MQIEAYLFFFNVVPQHCHTFIPSVHKLPHSLRRNIFRLMSQPVAHNTFDLIITLTLRASRERFQGNKQVKVLGEITCDHLLQKFITILFITAETLLGRLDPPFLALE